MPYPSFLFRLTPRDEQITPLEIVSHSVTTSSVAADIDIDDGTAGIYRVPAGRILMLLGAVITTFAGAGSACNYAYIHDAPSLGGYGPAILGETYVTTGRSAVSRGNLSSPLLIGPEHYVSAYANFTSGAVSNQLTLSINGVLIPRGNFAI